MMKWSIPSTAYMENPTVLCRDIFQPCTNLNSFMQGHELISLKSVVKSARNHMFRDAFFSRLWVVYLKFCSYLFCGHLDHSDDRVARHWLTLQP